MAPGDDRGHREPRCDGQRQIDDGARAVGTERLVDKVPSSGNALR
jgi:hypothetical protein